MFIKSIHSTEFYLVESIDEQTFLITFGNNLKELRLKHNLSQKDLANDADIPINQVGRIERAEIKTSLGTIFKISKALKVKPKDLFEF